MKTICENVKYMLLIVKYPETLILKTTKYWDGLRTVLDPCGRVRGWMNSCTLLFFLVLECLDECGMKKALKLVIEYEVKCCDGDTRPLGWVTRSSSGLAMKVKTLGLGVEWCDRVMVRWWDEDTRPRGRVMWWSSDVLYSTRGSSDLLRSWSSYSTSGSSGLTWSGPLLPDSSSTAPNHLKSTQICNMHANLS